MGEHHDEVSAARALAQRDRFTSLARRFVQRYAGSSRQRSAQWYTDIGVTVGGSEIAAAMGRNPYKSFGELVAEKAGVKVGWDGGSIACWWGIMFEDVMARFIEIDCGTQVVGDDICIRAIPGNRYSPDGYCVLGMYQAEGLKGAEWRIWTTDRESPPEQYCIVLIETKCPYSRIPDGKVPRCYEPQVWSGLVVSPVCHFGLFADGLIRRCSLAQLGPTAEYDADYHARDRRGPGFPVAWGLTGVYAPSVDAPIGVRIRGAAEIQEEGEDEDRDALGEFGAPRTLDASAEAWKIHTAYFGMHMDASAAAPPDVIDFGDCPRAHFERAMGLISETQFLTRHADPCFGDGRGMDLHSGATIGREIDRLRKNPPVAYYYLLGVIPWKIFSVNYTPVVRRAGFRKELIEVVYRVHASVAAAKKSGDPVAYLQQQHEIEVTRQVERARASGRFVQPAGVDAADVQDLFDLL